MDRLGLRLIFALILVLLLTISLVYAVPAEYDVLGEAMQATGAEMKEFSINAWVKVNPLEDNELEKMVSKAIAELGYDGQYKLIHQDNAKGQVVRCEVIVDNQRIAVMGQKIICVGNKAPPEVYLVINYEGKASGNVRLKDVRQKVTKVINKFGDSPRISTCLIGWLDGKLKDGEVERTLQGAFNATSTYVEDVISHDNFASYAGYSPSISEHVKIGEKKINLNMAMRYSKYDNRTYVIVASPIITCEY